MIQPQRGDKNLISTFGIYASTKNLYEYSCTYEEVRDLFKVSKTVATRLNFGQYGVSTDDGARYCPILAARGIQETLTRRKETFSEYISYVLNQNRGRTNPKRYGGSTNSPRQAQITLSKTINVIHNITKDHPKARGVFERELQKIGVFLPKLNP